jgi:hypothetical protein
MRILPSFLLCILGLYPLKSRHEIGYRAFDSEARGTFVQRWQMALFSKSAAFAAVRQQRQLLWPDKSQRQDHSRKSQH